MRARRIDIIGAGPAGLYAARLLKVARPDWDVTVHERMQATADTFGFGVVLTGSTMDNLAEADPATAEDIRAAGHTGHGLRLLRGEEGITLHGSGNVAIDRRALLTALAERARQAGAVVAADDQVDAGALDADIIIAADGVRSATRQKLAAELGANVDVGRGLFLWCGSDFALENSIFAPVTTDAGTFVAHAYPYAPARSTFLIETDDATWRNAGMNGHDPAIDATGSDAASLDYLRQAFADRLGGRALLGNRSRWSRFHTVHLDRWSHGNTVLIGDAAHTAHYTLGSGTKLAMEDAIALTRSLLDHHDIADAFDSYEQSRRPAVTRFQYLAARSQRWWESFPRRAGQPLPTLAVGFLTRSGNIDLDRLASQDDQPLRDALHGYGDRPLGSLPDDITDWVLSQPHAHHPRRVIDDPATLGTPPETITWSAPDPWAPAADAHVGRVPAAGVVWLNGMDTAEAVHGRIDLAERLRLERGATVIVDVPTHARGTAAAALVAGRCDLVRFTSAH